MFKIIRMSTESDFIIETTLYYGSELAAVKTWSPYKWIDGEVTIISYPWLRAIMLIFVFDS